uniref:Uncharacterized protein n=1 Tax=Dictyopteris divaricata TaxID=156996 RepID=A0A4Y5T8N8_9PHAE|nr:hypothetical protein DicdiMp15 [Dictyopteris divaricata]QDB64124.1 hypothetical protein DicdiMp15 [Dictyopteris divaricata]
MIATRKIYIRRKAKLLQESTPTNFLLGGTTKRSKVVEKCLFSPNYALTPKIVAGGALIKYKAKNELDLIKINSPNQNIAIYSNDKWYTGQLLNQTGAIDPIKKLVFLLLHKQKFMGLILNH